MSSSKPTKPPGLKAAGARFWRQVTTQYTDLNPSEEQLLVSACRTIDTIARLDEALVNAPLMTKGVAGQDASNPLVGEVRMNRMALRSILASLNLPSSDEVNEIRDAMRAKRGRANAQKRFVS